MTQLSTDLPAFIAEHAHPYDPATDTYRRAPFAQPVKAGKNTAIYNAHSYHTKVPPQGIVPYIEHYTEPGDLILDSFCGSGMTGVAALMTGRNAILNDLSPAAVHIGCNYCTPVDTATPARDHPRAGRHHGVEGLVDKAPKAIPSPARVARRLSRIALSAAFDNAVPSCYTSLVIMGQQPPMAARPPWW